VRIPKFIWVILGFAASVIGFLILKNSPLFGFLLMMAGVGILFTVSISLMHISGRVKENPFYTGSQAAEKFSSHDNVSQKNADVWDQLTKKQEKQE